MENESVKISLSGKYNLANIDGMTIHTLLTALADAERMYKKVGMTGLGGKRRECAQIDSRFDSR